MINRKKTPDGLPFRLYCRTGTFQTSYGYKLPSGVWAFKLSASNKDKEALTRIRDEAIKRANELNGDYATSGTVAKLVDEYFNWQQNLKHDDARRKAASTLEVNLSESKNLVKAFGKMAPSAVKTKHVYAYLALRADGGAPAKANKEVALLSAILEYARARGELELNPCKDIRYNPTRPSSKYVSDEHLNYALDEARRRKGSYHILALCVYAAYLTTSRPDEMRSLTRQSITKDGLLIKVGKKKAIEVQKSKLIEWSPKLKSTIDEALALQRTDSFLIFSNASGQKYTRSGWTTIWNRLMDYCEVRAKETGESFERFALKDMRSKSVTDRKLRGEINITDATGHVDERMINKTYDRRITKKAKSVE